MIFSADKHQIMIQGAPKAVSNYLKNYMGAMHSEAKNVCRLPRTLEVMRELYMKVSEIRNLPGFIEEGRKIQQEVKEALANRKDELVIPGDRFRPYQRADVEFLVPRESAGIFNEPRTGKTPTTLEMIKQKGTRRNLIVCPASLIWTWAREAQEWFPEASVHVIDGKRKPEDIINGYLTAVKEGKPSLLVVSKNRVGKIPLFATIMFDLLVVDEAHFLRNYKTAQSKAIFRIKRKESYPVTGTPTVKHPSDIYGLLHLMFPKAYTSYWGFCSRYFHEAFNPHSDTGRDVGAIREDRKEELQRLIALNSVSRKRKDVMPWLPEKNRKTIYAKMLPAQQKAYDEMRRYFTTILDSGEELDTPTILGQLMRLRQISIDPRLVGAVGKGCKTELLLQVLDDREDKSKPVVVMSMFTSYLKMIAPELVEKGYRVGMIHGEMTNKEKERSKDDFQSKELDILLCNTISAGVGHTLDRGDTIIFIDNAWNPVDMQQAEDRVTPTTPEMMHEHNITYLATMHSVDERMFSILERKAVLTDLLNTNAREALRELIL